MVKIAPSTVVPSVEVTGPNLPGISITISDDSIDFRAHGPNGDARFLNIAFAGGHYEITKLGSLVPGTGLEIGGDGYVVVRNG
jgi:hypothetical protein